MKDNFTTQEIILPLNTGFSSREYTEKSEKDAKPSASPKEKLAEACWNGLVTEMLPEICITKNNKPLPLWELGQGKNIFYLQMGEADVIPEVCFTLNPYALMETATGN